MFRKFLLVLFVLGILRELLTKKDIVEPPVEIPDKYKPDTMAFNTYLDEFKSQFTVLETTTQRLRDSPTFTDLRPKLAAISNAELMRPEYNMTLPSDPPHYDRIIYTPYNETPPRKED
jgi:hypothetical protein